MKIKSATTGGLYEFTPDARGEEGRYLCPECSAHRKKSKDKCFAWNVKSSIGYCHNCNTSFFVFNPSERKQYLVPEWKNDTSLTDKAVKWFTGRMISQSTLNKMKIYSSVEFMPQLETKADVICMPYFFQDTLVNVKYRGPQKSFKMFSGGELIFYNQDALLNYEEIIIVEGEIDALSFIECGYDNVISVPNGANLKLEVLDNYIALFDKVKKIYLATDQDTKGVELRDELIRRLGSDRCFIVNFRDCKDANEFLVKYGGIEFPDLLKGARMVPTKGIVTVGDIYNDVRTLFYEGEPPGKVLNEPFDEFIRWETGRLSVVTGVPSHGKSEFVDYLICKLNILYGWKAAYFTPENFPLKFHFKNLFEKLIGKGFGQLTSTEMDLEMARDYISENFFYIMHEEDNTVDAILAAAKALVKSKGIKILVIDPYNRLEHQYVESETQYISRFLDKLSMFAQQHDVLVFLVAHPRKMEKDAAGKPKVPSLYDINGSANFFNKCDYGFTLYRQSDANNVFLNKVDIHWQKIKFKHMGNNGVSELDYDRITGRFHRAGQCDLSNWLVKNVKQQILEYQEEPWEIREPAF